MDFAKHIKSLLTAYDKLCIPGLGTFLTRNKPAEVVPGMNYMKPPSKEVSFDSSQKKDDSGIMASYIARQEKISIQEAYEKIRIFVENINERIHNDRTFSISGIGSFGLKDGKIFFQPEVTGNLRVESFGLPDVTTSGEPVTSKPEMKSTQPPVNEEKKTVSEQKKTEPVKTEKKPAEKVVAASVTVKTEPSKKTEPVTVQNTVTLQSGNGKWIFIGIAVPVVAILISIFLILPNTDFFSGLFSSSKKVTLATEKETALQTNTTDVGNYLDTLGSQEKALMYNDKTDATSEAGTDDKYAHCKNFYIVAGSFRNARLAKRFRDKLRNMGYEAEILRKGDTNRVYIKKFTNRAEALKELENLQSAGMNVWLLSV